MHESCGIFGVYARGVDVARLTFFALFALQHRGQESAGIATSDGTRISIHTSMGLVAQAFTEQKLSQLEGYIAIGHNRYSTTGSSQICNAQPIVVKSGVQTIALAHNGNLINAKLFREELSRLGYTFASTTDSEVIAQLILSSPEKDLVSKIRWTMRRIQGAYSLVIMTDNELIGVRGPMGVRPLCLGRIDGGWAIASETCALDHIGAQFVREVEPNEIVQINDSGLKSFKEKTNKKGITCKRYASNTCLFQLPYDTYIPEGT